MSWWQIDDPTPARIIEALTTAFVRRAQTIFKAEPEIQTVLMTVGQYWADNARDEVHAEFVVGTTDAEPWPHDCDESDDADPFICRYCRPSLPNVFDLLPYGVDTVTRAIEAFCSEGANEDMPFAQSHLPLLLARRDDSAVEFVGRLQRSWLRPDLHQTHATSPDLEPLFAEVYRRPDDNGPRHVLADCLQAAGDPRGTFMALQLHPEPTVEMRAEVARLLARNAPNWLGALSPVGNAADCRFERGFVAGLALRAVLPADLMTVRDAPAWSTVDTVLLPRGWRPTELHRLPMLREVARIVAPAIITRQMARWQTKHLVLLDPRAEAVELPHLEHLTVMTYNSLPPLKRRQWKSLKQIDILQPGLKSTLTEFGTTPSLFVAAIKRSSAKVRALRAPRFLRGKSATLIERVGPREAHVRGSAGSEAEVASLHAELSRLLPRRWRCVHGRPLGDDEQQEIKAEMGLLRSS